MPHGLLGKMPDHTQVRLQLSEHAILLAKRHGLNVIAVHVNLLIAAHNSAYI